MIIYQKNKCSFKRQGRVLIIDFGSQVTKLIARRIRELGVYSEIITPLEVKKYDKLNYVKGIVFPAAHPLSQNINSKAFQKKSKKKDPYSRNLLWFTINS